MVGFVSLGCPKNLVDSEVMMGLLDRAGARLTARAEEAEILVVNTCSFIDTAKQESVDAILEMARLKTSGSAKKLIVAGCLVERYRDEIRRTIPEVDAVVGTGELESILEAAGLEAAGLETPGIEAAGIAPSPAPAPSPFTILTTVKSQESTIDLAPSMQPQKLNSPKSRSGQEAQAGTHKIASKAAFGANGAGFSGKGTGFSGKGTGFSPYMSQSENVGASAPGPSFRAEGNHRERQGRFRRDAWQGAAHLLPTYLYDETTPRLLSTPRASAYIKIAEGCDHPCSFCVIPNLRGKFRSRRFESVVAEAQQLVARGVKEITLIGQDTTCYGEDLGLKDGLATLLDALAAIPGLRWLRFLYAYPNRITGRLLETMARHDNICKYLDVPLQHASAAVLKSMKRGAGAGIFLKTLEKVRAAVPGVALRTSFIVGFPGESSSDFQLLEEFIGEARFDWLGVFAYSDEEGSGARALHNKIPKRSIEARKRRLMKLQQSISRQAKQRWVGREVMLLAEGESEETPLLWEGRTQFHAPEIDGKVYINDFGGLESLQSGSFYRAHITEAHDYDVVARIVAAVP